jgi:hypothetical protein
LTQSSLRANETASQEAKEACNERLKEILKATKQQIDALYPSPATTPTADTIEEEDDDDENRRVQPQHFHFVSPETTRSQSGTLQLSPCHQSVSCLICRLFYRQLLSRITNIAQQSADRRRGRKHERGSTMDSKAASTKEVPPWCRHRMLVARGCWDVGGHCGCDGRYWSYHGLGFA